ncbi:MAG: type II toxin-antitoxin system VapC family toxin [Terracidiphilus sp.]|nr:type II toxin-antitoxin system VapC family toxin [Terracidiphilus sp.]MDR3799224.1 type II toxin-antitoxin system VapC family toxin [Terracidiphilus sp.]
MGLVLDASAAIAWFVQRSDRREATLADQILTQVELEEALVPALWFTEVLNGVLTAERLKQSDSRKTASFLGELAAMPIVEDSVRPRFAQDDVLELGRKYKLTAYDATYLELALRTRRTLATFDRQLADATRKAGGRVFGDRP